MSSIGNILHNPVYLGKVRWNYRRQKSSIVEGVEIKSRPRSDECFVAEGLHPALISQAQWDLVEKRLASHADPRAHVGSALKNPYAGLMFCSECGRAMILTPIYDRPVGSAYRCVTHGCATCGVDAKYVDAAVLDSLNRWLVLADRPDSAEARQTIDAAQSRLAAARSALAALLSQKDRLHDLLESDVYDVPTYLDRMRKLEARITAAQQDIDQQLQQSDPVAAIIALRDKIAQVIEAWDHSAPGDLNFLLRQVVGSITYHKTRRCYRSDNPAESLKLDVFPVLH